MKKFFLSIFIFLIFTGCVGDVETVIEVADDLQVEEGTTEEEAIEPDEPIEYETLQPWFVPPSATIDISPIAREQLIDFLSEYVSLFSFGSYYWRHGTITSYFNMELLTERPLVLHKPEVEIINEVSSRTRRSFYYDPFDNRIEDAVFISGETIATDFFLYDIDNDGVPEIIIRWEIPYTCMRSYELFGVVDGEYTSIGGFARGFNLFYDHDGRIVVLYPDDISWHHSYYYFNIEDEIQHEEIITMHDSEISEWEAHHYSEEFLQSPTIFGTNIPITPIPRLTELENEIMARLKATVSDLQGLPYYQWGYK